MNKSMRSQNVNSDGLVSEAQARETSRYPSLRHCASRLCQSRVSIIPVTCLVNWRVASLIYLINVSVSERAEINWTTSRKKRMFGRRLGLKFGRMCGCALFLIQSSSSAGNSVLTKKTSPHVCMLKMLKSWLWLIRMMPKMCDSKHSDNCM